MLTQEEKEFKTEIEREMKQQGATKEELKLISDELVKNSIKKQRKVKDVAWAVLQ